MKNSAKNSNLLETLAYTLLSAATVGFVFYILYFNPVGFTLLITEDQCGEYGTSVCFSISGLLLIALSLKRGRPFQKVVWVIIGLCSIFIAGEEISWGQRIFNFSTPQLFRQANLQEEINLHNLKGLTLINKHMIHASMLLVWSILSGIISLQMPRLKSRLQTIGFPLIPIQLIPFFLMAIYFLLFFPALKSDEIGELFTGIAMMVWSFDQFLLHGWTCRLEGKRAVASMLGLLIFAALIAAGLTYKYPGGLKWRLNMNAARDYPLYGMYDQAQLLYEYIYDHPVYINNDTYINHGKMLLKIGRRDQAFQVLSKAANLFETMDLYGTRRSGKLRQLGIIYSLLEETDRSDEKFNQSINIDRQKLETTANPNEKAELLWSIAQTFAAMGDVTSAIEKANEAKAKATSARLSINIERWVESLPKIDKLKQGLFHGR